MSKGSNFYVITQMIGEDYECKYAGNCKYEPFEADPRNENRRNIAVSPVVVGLHIEISNCFIEDYESVIRFMKWLDDWKR